MKESHKFICRKCWEEGDYEFDKLLKEDDMNATHESICFFLTTGRTYTFRNVEILSDNETAISIRYTAMSDGQVKEAVFYKTHVAGVAKLAKL